MVNPSGSDGTRRAKPAGRRKVVTVRDVARLAGVGTMTVSRALRKPEMVSSELRARILRAVDELGYIPNRFASGLASGRTQIVPVIVPTLLHSVYIPFLEGVYAELMPLGYQIILGTTDYSPDAEDRLVRAFLGSFPDALFLSGVDHSAKTRHMLRRARLPIVEVMDLSENPLGINVGFSHYAVGVEVARYFHRKGFRRVAYAGTFTEIDLRSVKRIAGFQQTLRELGLADGLIERSTEPFSIGLGARLLHDLLEQQPKLEAVFFANDDLAAGALFECKRRGLRVPEQLAIMGFNDQEIAAAMVPSITSVATPRRDMGKVAARLLVEQLDGKTPEPVTVDLGFQIVERQSTGGP